MTEPQVLKSRLAEAGVQQTMLAREAGLSKSMVCHVLAGERRLTPNVRETAERLIRERVARAAGALVSNVANGG